MNVVVKFLAGLGAVFVILCLVLAVNESRRSWRGLDRLAQCMMSDGAPVNMPLPGPGGGGPAGIGAPAGGQWATPQPLATATGAPVPPGSPPGLVSSTVNPEANDVVPLVQETVLERVMKTVQANPKASLAEVVRAANQVAKENGIYLSLNAGSANPPIRIKSGNSNLFIGSVIKSPICQTDITGLGVISMSHDQFETRTSNGVFKGTFSKSTVFPGRAVIANSATKAVTADIPIPLLVPIVGLNSAGTELYAAFPLDPPARAWWNTIQFKDRDPTLPFLVLVFTAKGFHFSDQLAHYVPEKINWELTGAAESRARIGSHTITFRQACAYPRGGAVAPNPTATPGR